MSDRLTIDITPDKSLIKKLGLTGYRTEQAIAELVDNSIDARIEGRKEIINVKLDFEKREIIVSDDGTGMDKKELQDAMTIAKATKSDEKLGKFGIGMKSACSTLGKEFTIVTSKPDSNKEYTVKYDEERWLSDRSLGWQNFELFEEEKKRSWHGTTIKITKLNVPLYPNQVTNFKDSFNIRYAPYLWQNQIEIRINTTYCEPEEPAIEKGTRRIIEIDLHSGNHIRGWIGLLEKRSIRGNYGIHLFKNGRLIKAYEKFGFRTHPELAKIIGRLDLDHVPVNFHKSAFIEDSPEYKEAENAFQESATLKEIIKEAMKRKEELPGVGDVLAYISGSANASYLDTRISAEAARQLIEKQEQTEIRIEDKDIAFFFISEENTPLYTVKKAGPTKFQVTVNKKDGAFKFFKNPLFLLGLIGIEVKLLAENPEVYEKFISKRNVKLQEFTRDWGKKEVEKRARVVPAPILPGYSLANDLVVLHDSLTEEFEGRVQFTALSTLAPYLHNLLGKVVYTVYTEPGMGEKLVQLISYHVDDARFVTMHDPSPRDLEVAMNSSGKERFVVVREYAQIYGSTFASPEEAWVDLLVEIKKNKLPVAESELRYILEELARRNLIDRAKLNMLIKRRKQEEFAMPIVNEVL